ncbi:MAG: hypothetical protein M3R21_05310 [Candidatus Dormibacteraeota bacterium]|nr:hypothetical protein [Candidatus Dormibacteraeota bacterium]
MRGAPYGIVVVGVPTVNDDVAFACVLGELLVTILVPGPTAPAVIRKVLGVAPQG